MVLASTKGPVLLHLVADPEVNATVALVDDHFVVGVYDGLLSGVFELCAAWWTDPAFAPWLGDPSRLTPISQSDAGIPRGLEAVVANSPGLAAVRAALGGADPGAPRWLAPALAGLCAERRSLLERTLDNSIRFTLFHELAHVVNGHLGVGQTRLDEVSLAFAEVDEAAADDDECVRALEVHADRHAFAMLFRRARMLKPAHRLPSFIGALATLTVLHARRISRPTSGLGTHPPLWFRVSECLSVYERTVPPHGSVQDGGPLPEYVVMAAIVRQHRELGDWLDPIANATHEKAADGIRASAREVLGRLQPVLDDSTCSLVAREANVDMIDDYAR